MRSPTNAQNLLQTVEDINEYKNLIKQKNNQALLNQHSKDKLKNTLTKSDSNNANLSTLSTH